jgi:hypothetical protein
VASPSSCPSGTTRLYGMKGFTVVEEGGWPSELLAHLNTVEPLGSFATSDVVENMPVFYPIINVVGVGRLSFPLMDLIVQPLIAVSSKAPYGKGEVTSLDDSVRKAWQIDPSLIKLGGGAEWEDCLKSIVHRACRELGFSDERFDNLGIHANLYKLLLYETGGHFLAHRDTEKEPGMFGTLIIQLPSTFTGGDLVCP